MTLTPAEKQIVKAAIEGDMADFTASNERAIRAEIIHALVVGSNQEWPTHAKGVQVAGANIIGTLDFQGAKISHPLV